MKIYKYKDTYWLISDILENKGKVGIRWRKNVFALNYDFHLDDATLLDPHEYLFDNSKRTNIIWRIYRSMMTIVLRETYHGSTTKMTVIYAIKEFEETFKDILNRFTTDFLTIKEKENENL